MQNNDMYSGALMVADHEKLLIEDSWLPCYVLENDRLALSILDFYDFLKINIAKIYLSQSIGSILEGTFDRKELDYLLNKKFVSFKMTLIEYEVHNQRMYFGEISKIEELCEIIINLGNACKRLTSDQLAVVEKAEAFIKQQLNKAYLTFRHIYIAKYLIARYHLSCHSMRCRWRVCNAIWGKAPALDSCASTRTLICYCIVAHNSLTLTLQTAIMISFRPARVAELADALDLGCDLDVFVCF